jgi:hypothetical protein
MNAYLIVEAGDPKTAEWFYADASWQALDAAGRAGFDETRGFAVVLTLPADAVCIAGDDYQI